MEAAIQKKRGLEREIQGLEKQIFALETSYLENSAQIGDLVRGWGDIATALNAVSGLGGAAIGSGSASTHMKKRKVMDSERIFSSSSVTARDLIQSAEHDGDDGMDFLNASGRPSKIAKTSSSKKRPGARKKAPSTVGIGAPSMEPLFVASDGPEMTDI